MFNKRNIKSLSDSELIQLSKTNQKYFGELYERYFDCIFRFVFRRLGGNETITGDLSQQTFMKAMVNISKYEDRGMPFSSWLYRIQCGARRNCLWVICLGCVDGEQHSRYRNRQASFQEDSGGNAWQKGCNWIVPGDDLDTICDS